MSTGNSGRTLFVVLGNQLFPVSMLRAQGSFDVFMAEDVGLCKYVRHHKQKIVLFLSAMRAYRDALRKSGYRVHYEELKVADETEDESGYETKLHRCVSANRIQHLLMWEVEDRFFEKRVEQFASALGISLTFLSSPMFVTPRETFAEWIRGHRPHMATFYRWQRERLGVLLNKDGSPRGGRWSFDEENRESLPDGQTVPGISRTRPTSQVRELIPLVNERFADHPGMLSAAEWWLPTTRRQALAWLREFLADRFDLFGPYEDALSTRDPVLFHSVLSPLLNLGLITPGEVLDRALAYAAEHRIRMNSLEGFVRQIIGWREFVRGIYQHFCEEQERRNFFGHTRRLTDAWYGGTTGMVPLDDVIRKGQRYGWAHHIERLMIAGNLMTLCEIEPREAYCWFTELFVDSSDWVMVPNVYGMGIFSDGGIFSTKPYICGSNYIRRMSNYPKPQAGSLFEEGGYTWCDALDGLYWRFVDKNRSFFRAQPRMAQMVGALDRMNADRRAAIFRAAELFLSTATR